jgi:hypothetical protein
LARKRLREAEVARLAAADHVGRLTSASKASRDETVAPPLAPTSGLAPTVPTSADSAAPTERTSAAFNRSTNRGPASEAEPNGEMRPADQSTADQSTADQVAPDEEPVGSRRRRHHLIGRQ